MTSTAVPAVDVEAEFDALLSAEKRRLYGIAYSILRDPGEAEDALQEAMLRAWRHWSLVRKQDAREAWLTRVCVNHCINRRRGLWLRRSSQVSDQAPAKPDPRLDGRLLDLDRCFRTLSPRQRAAIALHYHHGYTIPECAELMLCSAGSVRTHIARALASMRKEMTHD